MPPPPKPPNKLAANRRGPVKVDPAVRRDRCRGSLLGLAVGDAFGWYFEDKRLRAPLFPEMANGPHTDMRVDYEREIKAGQVTDDTQMACVIAHVLRLVSHYNQREAVKQYMNWKEHATGLSEWMKEVLGEISDARLPESIGKMMWLHRAKRPAFNDALARTAPIGVFYAAKQEERIRATFDDCALTHFDPRCQLACVAINASIAAAITSVKGATAKEMVAAANTELAIAASTLGRAQHEFTVQIQEALQALREDLRLAEASDPMLYGPELHLHHQHNFVRTSFRLAYWELSHASSFEAGLLDVVNRGGDSDTNGAIVGALLGAQHGEENIPERWRRPVLEVLSGPMAGPLGSDYHPRSLMAFADKL